MYWNRLASRHARITAAVAGVVASGPFPAMGQTEAERGLAVAESRSETAIATVLSKAETLERLGVRLDVEFSGQPLHDVVRYLALTAGVALEPLWIDERWDAGLDPMVPVHLDSRGLTALECLEIVLEGVSKAQRLELGATWQFAASGAIEFGPRERLNRPAALRAEVYDIQDLLATLPSAPAAPRLNMESASRPRSGGSSGGSDWVFPSDSAPEPEPAQAGALAPRTPEERLIVLVTTLVEPEQWVRNGGDTGIIEFYEGALIVLAPDYVHRGLACPLGDRNAASGIRTKHERR